MNKKTTVWYAFATFVGTIIGVGLFGLPYVASQAGFLLVVFYFAIVAIVVIAINSAYAYVAENTKGLHRLPGYAAIYLGTTASRIAFIVKSLAIVGSLLAYLIVGGQFLASLLDGSVYLYTFVFFIAAAFLIWRDQKSIGPVELIMLVVFIIAILILFFSGIGYIDSEHLMPVHWGKFFVPYGVVLFSLWGTSIIPEVNDMLSKDKKNIRMTIISGILISVIVYFLFSLLVVGISGTATSDDAISGLTGAVGPWVLKLGYFFGVLTTFTSFIALGLTMKKIFWYDYKLPQWLGWLLACFIPLILYVLGFQNYIDIISLTGAITLGGTGIIVMLLYLKARKKIEKKKKIPLHFRVSAFSLITFLVLGVVLEILYFFKLI
ncbi:MAG: aromatic amino acid transport family protein [Patescibacteria group bacterium]|nr:aromatic amino acid transport family protein [Patescibacteria group bacterium]